MEGLIPYVYRAIVEYANGGSGGHVQGSWFDESTHYMRLLGDSGRFQKSDMQLFHMPSPSAPASAMVHSPVRPVSSR